MQPASSEVKSFLIIGINYSPEPTGIGKYTGEMGTYLSQNGVRVQVVTAPPYYPQWKLADGYRKFWFSKEEIQGAKIVRCPLYVPAKPGGAKRMLQDASFFLSSMIAVTSLRMRGKKSDLVFVASPSLFSGLVGLWYSKVLYRKAKMVYHIQDLQIDAAEELGMIKLGPLLNFLKWIEKKILEKSDYVSSISHKMIDKINSKKAKLQNPPILFPNWASSGSLFRKTPNEAVIRALGINPGKKMVFYSGAMGEKQGLDMVLSVAQKLINTSPDLLFVLAGQGPFAVKLQQQAQEMNLSNVLFISLQPMDIFNELLNHASLHLVIQKSAAADLLLPSKLTNILGVGGLALVTAEKGTSLYDEIYRHEMGLLIPPEDERAFLAVLEQLGTNSNLHSQMKNNALTYSAQYLDQKKVIDSFLNAIQ